MDANKLKQFGRYIMETPDSKNNKVVYLRGPAKDRDGKPIANQWCVVGPALTAYFVEAKSLRSFIKDGNNGY